MKVVLLGFLHESNTFLAAPTTYADFVRNSVTSGDAMFERWKNVRHEVGGMLQQCALDGLEVAGGMVALAAPSGTVAAEAFERIAEELLSVLRSAGKIDGVLVALHGATVSEEFPDADGEILERIRGAAGPAVPIIGTLDLHANVSQKMVRNADALVIYRTNPHLDQYERGVEAARLMRETLSGNVQPVQALVDPPFLIRMSSQHTVEQPARGLYDNLEQVLQWPGILSASVAMGFYYADVAEMGASFLAVADGDRTLAQKAANWMATRAWQRRAEFSADLPDARSAVAYSMRSANKPVVLLDIGDNVGGGSAADSTFLLAEILQQGAHGAVVVLHDAEAVARCVAAGVRSQVEISVGGKCDAMHGEPVRIRGRVQTLSDGIFTETRVRHGGWGKMDQGVTAVVVTDDDHSIVLTTHRMPPFSLEQILSLGIHPERKQIVVVKGVVAPRAAYEPIAGEIVLVDTPGSTSDNPARFVYRNRRCPLYPLEPATWNGDAT